MLGAAKAASEVATNSEIYGSLRQSLGEPARSTLTDSQRQWVRQRDACGTQSDCVNNAYEKRLRELAQAYDLFAGWTGEYTNWADLDLSITHEGGRKYQITISGAGQNFTCDGTLSARESGNGRALVISHNGERVRLQAVGTGLLAPTEFDAVVEDKGFCGAAAPVFQGFFARTSNEQAAAAQGSADCSADDASCQTSPDLTLAGIESPKAARAFLAGLKRAAAGGDRQALVSQIKYPFRSYDGGKVIATYKDAPALLKDYDKVFTPAVIGAIEKANVASLFVNSEGAMIGQGEVWFDGWSEDDKEGGPILITAINS